MKKMLMIAAILITAGMAQSSQVAWIAASGITAVGGGGLGTTGCGYAFTGTSDNRATVVALFSTATWAADFASYQSGLVNSQTAPVTSIAANSHVALGGIAMSTAFNKMTSAGAAGVGGYNNVAAVNSFVASTQQSVFYVVFNDTVPAEATHYTVSVLQTQTLGATGIKSYTTTWADWGGTATVGTWTAVVPEPTSMALLALGVAAIGLRRKLRK